MNTELERLTPEQRDIYDRAMDRLFGICPEGHALIGDKLVPITTVSIEQYDEGGSTHFTYGRSTPVIISAKPWYAIKLDLTDGIVFLGKDPSRLVVRPNSETEWEFASVLAVSTVHSRVLGSGPSGAPMGGGSIVFRSDLPPRIKECLPGRMSGR